MTRDVRMWRLDLLFVVAVALAGVGAVVAGVEPPLRTIVAVPLLILAPGYALVAASFPARRTPPSSDAMRVEQSVTAPETDARGLLFSVRVVLSVAASLVVSASVTLVNDVVVGGFAPLNIAAGVGGLTVVLALVALVRRFRLPADERGGAPGPESLVAPAESGILDWSPMSGDRSTPTLSYVSRALLVVSLLAFVSSVGFAMVETHTDHQEFTELYLTTENESGDHVAVGYQDAIRAGDPIDVAIANHEGESTDYTVVVERQEVSGSGDDARVTASEELTRMDATVAANQTKYVEYRPQTGGGDGYRLVFLLYEGDAPSDPSRSSAYRSTQVVVPADGGAASLRSGGIGA